MLNNTYSSAGEEYLYSMLRIPEFSEKRLIKRDKLIEYFMNNEEETFKFQEVFAKLGRTKSVSLSEFIDRFSGLGKRSNLKHYILDILLIISVAMLFIKPAAGIIMFILMIFINIGTYYKEKAEIESYFTCLKYLMDMINCGSELKKFTGTEEVNEYIDTISADLKKLKNISRGMFLISINGTGGSLAEIIMEYIRMLFHVDIIKFNSVLDATNDNIGTVEELFDTFGILESCMAVASFRKKVSYSCKPKFENIKIIKTQELYHPILAEPVSNSIDETRSVLITGSNASGKSTFLKTVAINSILAQTIYTCTAKSFNTTFYKIYTSMALRDDLINNESYYMVEIKSIKRILDEVNENIPVLCFVDEVLRGTNTVERIAASTHILKSLCEKNALCFAATHDIELTNILENYYSNYHFTEEVSDDDVLFNYKLISGRATSRNAIKLLKIIGFESEIISNAENMAGNFTKNGLWNKIP
jgi:DNA mismatch repair ATPase MutS